MGKKADWLLIVLFLGFIYIFGILLVVLPDKDFSPNENRYLQQMPKIATESIIDGKFMGDFEKYLSDQFPVRDFWVTSNTVTKELIQRKDINGIYTGSDGYLLETFDLPDEKLQEKQLSSINKFVNRHSDKNVYFSVAPTSIGIMTEKLPAFAPVYSQKKYIDDIYLKLDEKAVTVDIYGILEKNKDKALYYKTDHHWMTLGAYYGFTAISDAMGNRIPSLEEFDIVNVTDDFLGTFFSKGNFPVSSESIQRFDYKSLVSVTATRKEGGDEFTSVYEDSALRTKDKYAYFLGGNFGVYKIKTDSSGGKKLVMIKDSYSHCLVPFFIKDYSEIYMLDMRYINDNVNNMIDSIDPDDILIIYNAKTLSEDTGINKLAFGLK